MTLQNAGNPISFRQIKDEFGLPPGKNLGAYRVNFSNTQHGGSLSGLPLDDGIPQSGEIKFSDFYGKRMNTVVDCYRGGTQTTASARDKYNNFSRTVVIGEYRSPKSSPNNEKIIVNVNKTFQGPSGSDNRKKCSLRTGVFGNGIIFRIDIGSNGKIVGAGGDGGRGSDGAGSGEDGKNGTSGLGLEQPSENGTVVIANNGLISAGYGGGGGGGGAHDHDKRSRRSASGGGGGGGAGLPAGEGGRGGRCGSRCKDGTAGSDGGLNSAGSGGEGGNNDGEAVGGEGGHGGRDGQNAEYGERGEGGEGSGGEGGNRGNAGAAIRRSSGSINFSVNGTVRGDTGSSGVE